MNKLFRIGITGPSGAGKGALSSILSSLYGIPVLDADKIYHFILESDSGCRDELSDNFGKEIISNGRVDRKALASVVFADGAGDKLLLLNSITHRYVIEETERRIENAERNGIRFAIVDAPLLIEANMHLSCDIVICVLSDREKRLERIMERDKITKEQALMRLRKQKDDSFYSSASDITVYNNGDMGDLEKQAREIALSLGIKADMNNEGLA
ncbi:MAG: dephospho-CoA kinase [Clostridia bacterium]|nr:dephospho-CoA kinase [Clostridia bacterium]